MSTLNIPTDILTKSPSPLRKESPAQAKISPVQAKTTPANPSTNSSPASSVSSYYSAKSSISNKSETKLNLSISPNLKSDDDRKESPKPEDKKNWVFEEIQTINEPITGEAEFTCDECNWNECLSGKFKKAELERHKKLWHGNYAFTDCPKCKQRFETIHEMNDSKEHKENCSYFGFALVSSLNSEKGLYRAAKSQQFRSRSACNIRKKKVYIGL